MRSKRVLRQSVVGLARTSPGRRLVATALSDDTLLREFLNGLSDRVARESAFPDGPVHAESSAGGFEDVAGVLSSNVINHGVSRLMIDEAAHLYRLVRSYDRPSVVEVGRFRGGTTMLLAAAGATVLSIDIDPDVQRHDRLLEQELEKRGLSDRVTLAIADSATFPVEPESHRIVLIDGDHSYRGVRADVEHWLPTLQPGGHLLLHDAFVPSPRLPWNDPWKVDGVRKVVEELLQDARVALRARAGSVADFVAGTDERPRPGRM